MPTTSSSGLNYKLTVVSVKEGKSENGPFLNIRATTPLKKKDTEITAMLFLNRGKKDAEKAPTAASQKAFDAFSGAKVGDVIQANGEIRPVLNETTGKESAYFVVRSLTTPLPKRAPKAKAEPAEMAAA